MLYFYYNSIIILFHTQLNILQHFILFFLAEAVPMGPWVNGQPDGGPAQNCVVYGNYGDGGWLDYFCTGRLTSICESTHYNLWFVFQNQTPSTCFSLVSFFGRMFLYYQGQIHTSNLNFGAKNRFLAPRCATILFSRRKENREKSIFEPILNIVKMSHTYHMKKI